MAAGGTTIVVGDVVENCTEVLYMKQGTNDQDGNRASYKDFANVSHQTLIANSYVLNRKSIEKGLPTVRHPLKLHFPKSKSIENPMA